MVTACAIEGFHGNVTLRACDICGVLVCNDHRGLHWERTHKTVEHESPEDAGKRIATTLAPGLDDTQVLVVGGPSEYGATHYIGMAGLSGYLPQTCEVYETYDDAVEGLASLHELGKKRAAILKRAGYIALNLRRDGNEYAEIEECVCDEPEIHSDSAENATAM